MPAPADAQKPPVVFGTVALEVGAQVQERMRKKFFRGEEKRDQEPPDPPVSIEEGMDGFELVMSQSDLHERREA